MNHRSTKQVKIGDVAFLGSPRAKKYIVTFPQEMSMVGRNSILLMHTSPLFALFV